MARILRQVFTTQLYRLPCQLVHICLQKSTLDTIAKARALHSTDNSATACLLVCMCVDTVTGNALPAMQEHCLLCPYLDITPQHLPQQGTWCSRYGRDDGIDMTATLYLPPGYDKDKDGPLPCLIWAYPREFKSKDAAGIHSYWVLCHVHRRCMLSQPDQSVTTVLWLLTAATYHTKGSITTIAILGFTHFFSFVCHYILFNMIQSSNHGNWQLVPLQHDLASIPLR